MRPVDLTPSGDRGGLRPARRTGFASYALVGLLIAALSGAAALATTQKKISDRKDEVVELSRQEVTARARAEALQPFADFAAVAEARQATVTSLATSRFDWERVMRELSLVLPSDVWLSNLTASVAPEVTIDGAIDIPTRDDVAGPALEIVGCATSHDAVAGFISALEDIDGVTRVGVNSSAQGEETGAGGAGTTDDCRTRDFIVRFEIVAGFDAVPPPTSTVPMTPPITTASADGSGVADARAAESAARNSIRTQTAKAHRAVDTLTPGS